MIPTAYIDAWRARAPWPEPHQVEHDLILSRAIVEIFSSEALRSRLAFRGGTALYKLHLPPARYSEDIDLVQTVPGSIGDTLDALRATLDPWLGSPKREFSEGRVTLSWRTLSEGEPPVKLKVKVEINSREHFTVFGLQHTPFAVSSRWFSGQALVPTYTLEEMLGTKLRALYQRRKGRDLFDLWDALTGTTVAADRVIEAFQRYMKEEGHGISRAEFEQNLALKLEDNRYTGDVSPLLAPAIVWDATVAASVVHRELLTRLTGDPWAGAANPWAKR